MNVPVVRSAVAGRLQNASLALLLLHCAASVNAAALFEDDFGRGMPGWTAVQPWGAYLDGPLEWQYDAVSQAVVEQSNIYTDSPSFSPTAIAPMLVNATLTAVNFTYSARLTAGDDDAFGLIFGYRDDQNFYRVTFARQARTAGFPYTGWSVDRMTNGLPIVLFGAGTAGHTPTFVNTQGRPFDVTLVVDVNNRLTLTVVDNPLGAAASYPLVTSQALPGPANGKVGVFTWGMSGGVPRGFRVQNLSLWPAALSGSLNGLTNWTPVVPPRADGTTALVGGNGQPFWALGVGVTGPTGLLTETGDCYAGNDAAGQVDFTGPTVVAGDPAWADYVVAARIRPGDDDAHGLLLRYANPTNFYRIALRSQNSAIGPARGLSVQKSVNRVYSEVFREASPQYDPVAGVPYDLVASIAGTTLQVLLVKDPEGEARPFQYGPFTVAGVPAGKVGLFSWGMSRTDCDWVSVQDGTPLYVSSPLGIADPPRGLNSFSPGTLVEARVTATDSAPGVRQFPVGWQGAGSVPASGAGSNVTFTITTFSRLHWLWQTQYQLSVTNGSGGTVAFPPGEWFDAGSSVSISAQPDPGYAFAGWSGDIVSSAAALNLTLDRPLTMTANFTADTDHDTLPDTWEQACFGGLSAHATGDEDGDGRTNRQEFESGSHPLVPDVFRIEKAELAGGQAVLTVSNSTGTRYAVQRAPGLTNAWSAVATRQFMNTVTSSVPAGGPAFWRLQQPGPPPDVLPFEPGAWTIVVLPDTQVYAASYPELFKDQARWIIENRERRNIKYVLHLGDITNNNTTNQWDNARAAMSMLDGVVPYAFVPGNHDYGPNGGTADRGTYLNDYFPASNYTNWPTLGGLMESNRMDNSYHLFTAGGVDWLVLALEFGPRNATVDWARSVLTNYPSRKVILITHAYLYNDDTRYDWAVKLGAQQWNPHAYAVGSSPEGVNDGEELWQKLVKTHPNFVMVLNGHVLNDGLGRLASTNDFGQVVHQMLVNYQMWTEGGEAFLRLLEFSPDGRRVQAKAYSPYLGTYKTDPQNNFTLTLDPPLTGE